MSNRARTRQRPGGTTERRPFPIVTVVIVGVVVVALGIVLALARGDDGDGGDGDEAAAFGLVSAEGEPLPELSNPQQDAAVGSQAPVVRATTPAGERATVGDPGEPALVVFLAHWCPHCQAEVPVLVEMAEDGAFEGIRLVGVLTGTNTDAPNFPPVAWLEREGWTGEMLLDDRGNSAAGAFGVRGYPFMVALDADGTVVARTSGEQPPAVIEAMVELAQGTDGR